MALLRFEGKDKRVGPALCEKDGFVMSYNKINTEFHNSLRKIQESEKELISTDVEIEEVYNIYRSIRRGATTRATELNYSAQTIDANNRWRKIELSKGGKPSMKMRELYVEIKLALTTLLRFSKDL